MTTLTFSPHTPLHTPFVRLLGRVGATLKLAFTLAGAPYVDGALPSL